jgi:GTPase SAR1 family protein
MSITCNICFDNFDEEPDHEPKVMKCGDTFCFKCLKQIKKEKEKFSCPICQKEIDENIEDMPTNKYVFNPKKAILCDLCYNEFDNNYKSERTPRILPCGDTFCSECLKTKSGSEIICMFCGKRTKENVDDLRVNKMIIEKLEEEIVNSMKYIDDKIEINKLSNQYSVGLMGETGGGKTSINHFFRTGKAREKTMSTVGYDYVYKFIKYKEKTVKLSLIDTAGQEKFMSLAAGALKGVYGLLLVFSLTPLWDEGDNNKYEKADKEEKKKIEDNYREKTFDQLTFWLNQLYQFNTIEKSIIYLLGNKVDDEEHRIIKYKDAKKFANENNLKYYETSAKTGKNINKVFFDLVYDLLRTFPNKIEKKNKVTIDRRNNSNNVNGSGCCLKI